MRWRDLSLGLAGVVLATAAQARTEPQLICDVTYAGSTHRVQAAPVSEPYDVPSVDIAGRFWFKAVMVRSADRVARIGIYVYQDTEAQPVLVQHARYLPPYPRSAGGRPVDLTGEQHLYAGPLERELIYRCLLGEVKR